MAGSSSQSSTRKPKAGTGPTLIKRHQEKLFGVFVDGVLLDRACRRLHKRVSMAALLGSLTSGKPPAIARYYTVIPYEDDSRHRSYLDAVERAGFKVMVKRLPRVGVDRQVSTEVEMATDMITFGCSFSPSERQSGGEDPEKPSSETVLQKSVIVVCPSQEIAYPFQELNERGVDTTTADFSSSSGRNVLKSAMKWIDLTHSETIWRVDE